MKIRSLLLGSVAAAGLSTGAFAADLGVLTSLDVCDALGLSGLTISSDTNCLQISGGVSYAFTWGDYEGDQLIVTTAAGAFNIADNDAAIAGSQDWSSKVTSWLKFVGTADSDFGPAKAVITLKSKQYTVVSNVNTTSDGSAASANVYADEAYVSIGDSTVIMAGKKGSLQNKADDAPLNHLGLFNSEKVDVGVGWSSAIGDGGHVIQITTDLGNGVSLTGGLENLGGTGVGAGTAFGVLAYAGDGIAAHVTIAAAGILDGIVEHWGVHAGFAGTFDTVKIVAAIAGDETGYWNGLASAAATFDIFTLAASVEAVSDGDFGAGASISAAVTDTVSINLGGRWYRDAALAEDAYQLEAALTAAVTETISVTGAVGVYNNTVAGVNTYYGSALLSWTPGGGFTSSIQGQAYSNGAYKATFKAAKSFQ